MLPDSIVPLSEVHLIDQCAETLGYAVGDLMLAAGQAIADYLLQHFPSQHFLFVCGSGNNGGDGYVAARILSAAGQRVSLWPVRPPRSDLCRQHATALPETVQIINQPHNLIDTDRADLVLVDAILGAGSHGPLRPPIVDALQQLKQLQHADKNIVPCIAVDVATGYATPLVLDQVHTLYLQVRKQTQQKLREHTAQLNAHSILDIGIPASAYQDSSSSILNLFPKHQRDGHKGHNGRVFVLAGWQFPGARHYCSMAALSSGCDLVHCWVDEDSNSNLDPACVRHSAQTSNLADLIESCDVVLLGPGMSTAQSQLITTCFEIASELHKPCVLDAAAIHHLKYRLRSAHKRTHSSLAPLLLTPHAGELAALLGRADYTDSVSKESAVHAFARSDMVILAKGPVDFISDGQQWQRNPYGNPRLAVGGTGDILAGLCAGFIARGCRLFDAARIAAYWSCRSADQLWHEQGPCYLADDLLQQLPKTLHAELNTLGLWPPLAPH